MSISPSINDKPPLGYTQKLPKSIPTNESCAIVSAHQFLDNKETKSLFPYTKPYFVQEPRDPIETLPFGVRTLETEPKSYLSQPPPMKEIKVLLIGETSDFCKNIEIPKWGVPVMAIHSKLRREELDEQPDRVSQIAEILNFRVKESGYQEQLITERRKIGGYSPSPKNEIPNIFRPQINFDDSFSAYSTRGMDEYQKSRSRQKEVDAKISRISDNSKCSSTLPNFSKYRIQTEPLQGTIDLFLDGFRKMGNRPLSKSSKDDYKGLNSTQQLLKRMGEINEIKKSNNRLW